MKAIQNWPAWLVALYDLCQRYMLFKKWKQFKTPVAVSIIWLIYVKDRCCLKNESNSKQVVTDPLAKAAMSKIHVV